MKTLKDLREEHGLSQIKLAVVCNIMPSRLSQLEAGYFQPTEKEVRKLIKGWFSLGVDLEKEILEVASRK